MGAPSPPPYASPGRSCHRGQKRGQIWAYADVVNPGTATRVVDLRVGTHAFWDRGVLGMAVQSGALRAQDILTPGDPTSFDGSLLRLDVSGPTVVATAHNPLLNNGVADDDFIVGVGLRNPFRIASRPGTNEVWIADVGWSAWEEVNVFAGPGTVAATAKWTAVLARRAVTAPAIPTKTALRARRTAALAQLARTACRTTTKQASTAEVRAIPARPRSGWKPRTGSSMAAQHSASSQTAQRPVASTSFPPRAVLPLRVPTARSIRSTSTAVTTSCGAE